MQSPRPFGASVSFHTLVMAVLLMVLMGWVLQMGQSILLPVFAAVIAVYVLTVSVQAMTRVPVIGRWPQWVLRFVVLLLFTLIVMVLGAIAAVTMSELMVVLPNYQDNMLRLLSHLTSALDVEQLPNWENLRAATVDKLNLQKLVLGLVGSLGSAAGMVFLVVVYAMFLMGERGNFARKLAAALPGNSAAQTQAMIGEINQRIGQYLTVKTVVNAILAVSSFVVLWAFGVDFALFWALMIGMLHYIPYIGSAVGVAFPVLLSLAQFGSPWTTVALSAVLFGLQGLIGNIIEPRMVGKQVNLSPFVVMLALSIWSALWGIAGAILAIPLTSIFAIVLASFPSTRGLAVLLADDVSMYETPDPSHA